MSPNMALVSTCMNPNMAHVSPNLACMNANFAFKNPNLAHVTPTWPI